MIYVLDTTALSALMRSEAEPSQRLLGTPPDDVLVPQPAVAEVRDGLSRLPRSRRRSMLEERLATLLEGLKRAEWDDRVSVTFGELKADLERRGTRVDDFDAAIAAHALALDATLVTDNLRHFRRIRGLSVESWTEPAEGPDTPRKA